MHVAPCLQCSAHANTRTHVHAHNQRAPSISTCTYVKRAKLAARACGKPFVLHHHAAAPPLQQQGSVSISCAPADMHTRAAAFAPDDRARRSRPTIAPDDRADDARSCWACFERPALGRAQRRDRAGPPRPHARLPARHAAPRVHMRAMQHRADETTCGPPALKLPPLLPSREGPCRCP